MNAIMGVGYAGADVPFGDSVGTGLCGDIPLSAIHLRVVIECVAVEYSVAVATVECKLDSFKHSTAAL